ncbi:interferon-inducible GTPase 5-like [Archocentrus centrarchus]|uniref:interferon-inducible GTPase 5-like n=1 Tax=Archocentrus centrarchus TaxID=63155 RepID=UPI0011E9F4AA|nr:interferon-inducible GTPase 5-like [Archocentrus centrarchus]
MEGPNDSCPKELAGVEGDLKNNDTAAAAAKIEQYLKEQNSIPLNIAITGESGSGKSTFINAFRGICDEEEGAAPTSVTETTSKVTPYLHPNYPNVTLWDLPGIDTTKFPAKKYLKIVEFEKFDDFIIISDPRFRENDVKLAQEIQRMKKKFYFVRSKIDNDINGAHRKTDFSEERTLTKIREDCVQRLRELGIESPQVFLVSSFDLQMYDFSLLQETLERELPSNKRDTLLFVMPNISPEIINKKKTALQSKIKYYPLGSAAGAAVPVPGLSVAVDVALLAGAVAHFGHAFGVDIPSLRRLSARTDGSHTDLCAVIISPLAASEISKEFLMRVFTQLGCTAALIVAEEASQWIPIVGIPVAMGLSFTTTSKLLNLILNQLAEDAQSVFERALGLKKSH